MATKTKQPKGKKTAAAGDVPALSPSAAEEKRKAQIETFCHEYLKDFNASRSYGVIFPDAKSPRANASKYLDQPAVQSRLAAIVKTNMDKMNFQTEDLIRETIAQAMLNPMDYMSIDDDGRPKIDLKKCQDNPEVMRLLKISFGVGVTKDGDKVHTYQVSTYDKDVAMERLFKMKRLYQGGDDEGNKGRPIVLNVNFPVPASGWKSGGKPVIDVADDE